MKFEKLNDNKIKITLNLNDLKEKKIDFHSFMSNPIETQNLFLDILKEAEKETGFITNNYNIHIEAFATSDGTFIFTVTKISKIDLNQKKKVVYKRKILKRSTNLAIYAFNSFDDYCNFCSFLNTHFSDFNIYLKNTSLILYNSVYYLILNNIQMPQINNDQFFSYISEFANICNTSKMFINKLLEYGNKLIPENAIGIGIKFFS